MALKNYNNKTICALSTPDGVGGIAIIRVSGNKSLEIVTKLCSFLPDSNKIISHHIYFGRLLSEKNKELIDEVLVSYFAEKKSFTGEETIEISCHGSMAIVSAILDELVLSGCRMANKGEFTYRAFLNDRIDLVQAEGVLALIESQSKKSARVAARQLKGELSFKIDKIFDSITWILANAEAAIDFSSEDISPEDSQAMLIRGEETLNEVKKLKNSYSAGRVLQEGLDIVLMGSPNVGKSSLLNTLLHEEKSIVTNIPGTTRDLVDGKKMYGGLLVNITDTAGLRESIDDIESIGIEKAREKIKGADLIFHVCDSSKELRDEEVKQIKNIDKSRTVLVANKCDLSTSSRKDFRSDLEKNNIKINDFVSCFMVSATEEKGIEQLEKFIEEYASKGLLEESSIVTSVRQHEKLQKAEASLVKTIELLKNNESPEFIAFELQEALDSMANFLGKDVEEDVLDRVFREFCIGK